MIVRIDGKIAEYHSRGPYNKLSALGKRLKKEGEIKKYRVVRMTSIFIGEPQNDHELHVVRDDNES